MKFRTILIFYLLVLSAIALAAYRFLSNDTYEIRDMVYYNEQLYLVSSALGKGMDREAAEDTFSCNILFREDEDYKTKLNELLLSGALILDVESEDGIIGKAAWEEERGRYEKMRSHLQRGTTVLWLTVFICGILLLLAIYISFIRPFQKLRAFTGQIAKGNLELPLPIHKNNFFGAYTESFDLMREELKKAKDNEYLANKSKKELVAELSHDIKTPVSTIKAVCEVVRLKESDSKILERIDIIEEKADTISRLADNMFHATLEELAVLKVEPKEESSLELLQLLDKLKVYGNLTVLGQVPECLVYMDRLRLEQVIDNIVNNALKYADTPITVGFREKEDGILIRIKDEGRGLPKEELAMITGKYYRGSNAEGKSGSGLGLYLAKNFMEQMRGGLELYSEDGFTAELYLRKAV